MDVPVLPREASARDLAASVEGNLFGFFRQFSALPGTEVLETARIGMHNAPLANPMFRGVWKSRLDEHEADDEIAAALAWFRERRAPYVFWWLGTESTPDDMPARLQNHGFIPYEVDAPGMIAAIEEPDLGAMRRAPATVQIGPVQDDDHLTAFETGLVEAFGMPAWAAQSWTEATRAVGLSRAPWRFYLARVDEQPVGTAMLTKGGGVAGVLAIGVREDWRGKGIGSALTLKPLCDARDEGFHHAALFATPMGEPVYRRLGFRRCHVPISRYLWRNAESG